MLGRMYEEERRRVAKDISLGCQSDIIINEGLESSARIAVLMTKQLKYNIIYRVIHKSLRDFRTRLRNNQDRRGRKEHINR